ncbi:Universal stress protein A [Quillaja saponaria]|uniref:Universal stress protein A n=1 Tax=Quillaja saponaria TaxID=32244 RepID=A0AAD7PY86_QUISA|nr:Universal stress protein A [Quillaja saponaria]
MEMKNASSGDQVSAGTETTVSWIAMTATIAEERRTKIKVMMAIDESDRSFYALKWALNNLFPTIAGPIKAETLILDGDPKEMICHATEQMPIDLLVIDSRGLGKLKRAFLGSVSDYCAHHAESFILIVKPLREHHHVK